eukprot:TRINITY_DN103058_c0_g1_i1.p1 TRINITY_DN103058_c0_g1~~TRINITY_DN103058_c0_g1_i1.p1  ORF type:complete len:369 (-),score=83.38 TRINITY_DN103058_c0_g1_i1:20-1126(-)
MARSIASPSPSLGRLCSASLVASMAAATAAGTGSHRALVRSAVSAARSESSALSPDGQSAQGEANMAALAAAPQILTTAGGLTADAGSAAALEKYTKYPHDCPGANLDEYPPGAKAAAECAAICESNVKCTGFTYSSRGQCYPKSIDPCLLNLAHVEPDFNFYSKIKPSNIRSVLTEEQLKADGGNALAAYTAYSHDCPGSNILELPPGKASKGGCAVYCNNDVSCQGFTYSDNGACYLKAASCPEDPSHVDSAFVFFSKGAPPKAPLATEAAAVPAVQLQGESGETLLAGFTQYTHDCSGENLAEFPVGVKTKGECAALCSGEQACKGFTYSAQGACYTKKEACMFDKDRHEGADYIFFSKGSPPDI